MRLKLLYIGTLSNGSTSLMRYNVLKKTLKGYDFEKLDTHEIINTTSRIWKTLAFRFKIGPLIHKINKCAAFYSKNRYNIVWIDKGIFIKPSTLRLFKKPNTCLIHYTPDAAFHVHNSSFFNKCIHLYNYCITTKSFEIDLYKKFNAQNVHFCTQAYDEVKHYPVVSFSQKEGVAFIGRYEKEREELLTNLLRLQNVKIKLAGNGWHKFATKFKHHPNLIYLGKNLYNEKYRETISSAKMSIGFLSKLLPELHTTRTFEIPACGTALLTERNIETTQYFNDDEVIFYSNTQELLDKMTFYYNNDIALERLTSNGHLKVTNGNFSYDKVISHFINRLT